MRPLVHVGLEVEVGLGRAAVVDVVRELRAVFERQGVERQVVRREGERLLDVRLPALDRLVGEPVDEVEVDVLEAGLARPAVALVGLLGGVDAVEATSSSSWKDCTPKLRRLTPAATRPRR